MGKEYTRDVIVQSVITPFGPQLLFDDMEALIKWTGEGDGADFAVTKAQTLVYTGNYSLDIYTRLTDKAIGDYAAAYRLFPPRFKGKMEIKGHIAPIVASDITSMTIGISYDDAVALLDAALLIDVANDAIKYRNSAGGYTAVTTDTLNCLDNYWIYFNLQVNFTNKKYLSVTVNNNTYDMSGIDIREQATSTYHTGRIDFIVVAATANRARMVVDNVLISG